MARVVVTGGAGFLGSHLCDALVERGDEVVCIDDLSTGRHRNIEHLSGHPLFTFVLHDVTAPLGVSGEVDALMHLASPASPADFQRLPIEILEVGSTGTHNMLRLALAKGARFFLASTSEVYGDPAVHPQPESYCGNVDPIGARSAYDEAKRFAEALAMAYHRVHGVEVRIARIFNTYGPRMRPDDGRVVSNLLTQALRGDPLTVHGDGSQTRSFCYVDDQVRGQLTLLDSDIVGPVNVGTDQEVAVLDLAELVLRVTGSQSGIEYRPLPQGDPVRRRPELTRARDELGWSPRVDLQAGLVRTAEWFCRHGFG
jgi:dTDP-glucose 4,6-dehydratase